MPLAEETEEREEREEEARPSGDRRFTQEDLNQVAAREKEKYRKRLTDLEGAVAERDELRAQVATLQTQVEEAGDLRSQLGEVRSELSDAKVRSAVQAEAVRLGAKHPDDIFALLPKEAVKLDEDGKISGLDKVSELAEKKPVYFNGGSRRPDDGGARPDRGSPREPSMTDIIRGVAGH
jgi:hypothetical protein